MNNQKFKVPIGTTRLTTMLAIVSIMLAIVSIWLASAISAWAYEVKICSSNYVGAKYNNIAFVIFCSTEEVTL